ncbi:DUF1707 domain-containing protein [Nannocystis sp.]|uniref:DUF1707 SHOCT-like domain-containing protein n=1 Tax=Nannocystis sp. TaxID=1962667 RepID=UPI002428C551|nr:DUF1707 domain-containing protein [Nannocystis sp.]MBK7830469.1 DUF1707 domain-containing protein [Nannocystis sp.]MBK9757220.1 DUF1707 domain-containing protein [Nannocystis sp.]
MRESPAEALRREREQARRLLGDGYADDHIDQDELDRRLERVEHAETIAELHGLTAELRPVAVSTALVPVEPEAAQRIPVLFGSVERVGAWRVAPRTCVRVIFGAALLDLRQAILPAEATELELEVNVVCGSLEVIVPPGWQIDNRCGAVLAAVEQDEGHVTPADERRVLRVTGRVLLGSFSVFERLPGERAGQARRRRRQEQKALGERATRALGRGED